MIHIVFCFDKSLVQQTLIAAGSCCKHSRGPIHFHFIVTPDAQELFEKEIHSLEAWVKTHINHPLQYTSYVCKKGFLDSLPIGTSVPKAACIRLFLETILPRGVEKVLYLDGDVFVTADIGIIASALPHGCILGAVEDQLVRRGGVGEHVLHRIEHGDSKYFNTGVLLMNIRLWEENEIGRKALDLIKSNPETFPYVDQDSLNVLFKDNWHELSYAWNNFVSEHRRSSNWQKFNPFKLACSVPAGILHYPGGMKPWKDFCYSHYRFHYRKLARELFPGYHIEPCQGFKQQLLIWIPNFCYNIIRSLYRFAAKYIIISKGGKS
ncbi:MAG: glycosyltransferase family 8 protein [Terrimicrobiaceae bacterium]